MARARNIKPSFFMNETLVELPFEVRLLFIGLWTLADREGRLEDRPKRIGMELFPADEVDVEACLRALEKKGLIERYETAGVKVVWVLNFKKHQSPHHTEKASTLPDKSAVYASADKREVKSATVNSQKDNGGYRSDLLNPDSLNPECLNKKTRRPGEERKAVEKKENENDLQTSGRTVDALPPDPTPKRGQIAKDFALSEEDRAFARE